MSERRRYLLYAPNHGMAVEAHLVETARRIAALLDRVLVLPLLPILETTRYERGLEHYLDFADFGWVSTAEFSRATGGEIDVVYHVVPEYAPEYHSSEIRAIHPVWLENIERFGYFERVGLESHEVVRRPVAARLGAEAVRRSFASRARAIALTHVNGLLEPGLAAPVEGEDHFAHHLAGPLRPHPRFARIARELSGAAPYAALHWRSSETLRAMAAQVLHVRLPVLRDLYECLPDRPSRLVVASDAEALDWGGEGPRELLRHRGRAGPNHAAAVDLALCAQATSFVGTEVSTFSHLIAHMRHQAGWAAASTQLVHAEPLAEAPRRATGAAS